jgi:lipopolysaccharide transport system permease protein
MGDTGVASTLYILAGMILWQAFIDAFQAPSQLVNSNRNMISKLCFPREALIQVGLGEVVFNLLIRLTLLLPAFWYFGATFDVAMLAALIPIVGLILIGMSLGLLLLPIGSLYQDVGRLMTMFIPFWMIITPIIYVPPTTFPGTLLNWVNPASPLLIWARDLLLQGHSLHSTTGMVFVVISLPLFVLGLVVYRIAMPVLIERMPA